ncbi:M15 family metallopeptidase [Sutcliffiella halmapala]|uniref:M15 family metallopeptidase n=1 Tax=Sutcliffiella halmapala TaxID=79882 RepID=UPI000995B412|nr:M15 family metallopeptidase [Sutcliffiella halmapala]
MLKKIIIGTTSISLLVGCSSFEKWSVETPVLISTPHPAKSTELTNLSYDKERLEIFLKKEEDGTVVDGDSVTEEKPPQAEGPITPSEQHEEEAIPVVANPTAINVMVNKFWALPEGYRPPDLIRPNVPFSFGNENSDRAKLREEAAQSLEMMFAGALNDSLELYARSGFRSYETQVAIFQNEIATFGYEQAVLYVARPGTSEHQTGLTMDITAKSVKLELVESFENTPEGKWLAENAHHYGFILRYPKGKTNITGYAFEPWHFRYVGVEIATEIYNNGLTLEEYMDDVREF